MGSGTRGWQKLYNCILFYISNSWKNELKEYAALEYPKLEFDNKTVILNYMVSEGFVESQKYVPVSFADGSIVVVR